MQNTIKKFEELEPEHIYLSFLKPNDRFALINDKNTVFELLKIENEQCYALDITKKNVVSGYESILINLGEIEAKEQKCILAMSLDTVVYSNVAIKRKEAYYNFINLEKNYHKIVESILNKESMNLDKFIEEIYSLTKSQSDLILRISNDNKIHISIKVEGNITLKTNYSTEDKRVLFIKENLYKENATKDYSKKVGKMAFRVNEDVTFLVFRLINLRIY